MASIASAAQPLLLALMMLVCSGSVALSGNPCDCRSSCRDFEREAKEQCVRICRQICGTEDHQPRVEDEGRRRRGERGEEEERHNPYHFGKERFQQIAKTQEGHFRVLENFSRRSSLLKGIEKYRFAILETEPRTFAMPSHIDADELFYVISGEGMISIIFEDNRETYEIRQGDIMMIPSGSIVYQINKHQTERLRIAMLLCPVSLPGHFEEFMQAGGQNPETFWNSFSDEILEAAFNAPRERIERVLYSQRKGEIFKASDAQIKALSKSSGKGKLGKPYNILKNRPSFSNNHGQFFAVTSRDYEQLKGLELDVSIANITSGSMMAPHYNSRSTKIAVVINGCADIEMACPHLSWQPKEEEERGREWGREEEREREWEREEERQRGRERGQSTERGEERHSYSLVRAQACRGDVFVVPASHPVVAVASQDDNLQLLCFGVNAENNKNVLLAGKNNVLKQLEKEAKELSFNTPAAEVDQLLNAQSDSMFLAGPGQRRGGRGHAVI